MKPVAYSQGIADTLRFGSQSEESRAPYSRWNTFKARALSVLLYASGVISGIVGTQTHEYLTTPNPYRVVEVGDGDTIKLANEDKIRIYGIDAPEEGQPYYEKSQGELNKLVQGRVIDLKSKGSSFERKVCEVWVNGTNVGLEMVRRGFAFAEEKYARGVYKAAEAEARANKRGIWTQPNGGERPWDYRTHKKKSK